MMFFKPLPTNNNPIISSGSVYYSNVSRAKNIIRIKERLIEEFQDLRSEEDTFYRLEFYNDIFDPYEFPKK